MTLTELKIFESDEFGKVRTAEIGGSLCFVASDVAKALGYKRPNEAVNQHCRATVKHRTPISGKMQDINYIPEGDIYRLIVKSKLPTAEKFEKWLFDEVIPTIRQTGGYVQEDREAEFIDKYFPSFAEETKLTMIHDLRIQNKKFKKQIEEQEPLVQFANKVSNSSDLIDMGRMAKLLQDEEIQIGRNRLFEWLRKQKILMKNNLPYQRFVDGKYFEVKESSKETPYGTKLFTTTYVTGKGQIYIAEKLRNEFTKAS